MSVPRQGPSVDLGARLFLSPGAIAFVGGAVSAAEHRHFAIQIAIGLEEPLRASIGGTSFDARALLIPSQVAHGLDSRGPTVILLIEPEGTFGRTLGARSPEAAGVDISAELTDRFELPPDWSPAKFEEWLGSLLGRLTQGQSPSAGPGPIVSSALDYLEQAIDGKPRLEDAARAVSISPSRLTHLFSEEVGIPFRRYVLWLRLRHVAEAVRDGANLTEAAIGAGFADSSHLTRVFKATFGIPPSAAIARLEIQGTLWGSPA